MEALPPTRLADTLSFDSERGVIAMRLWTAGVAAPRALEHTELQTLVTTLAALAPGDPAAAVLAAYGLALAAHAWRGRPTDAARGGIIQAGETLRAARGASARTHSTLLRGLEIANGSLLAGDAPAQALLDLAHNTVRHIDLSAERCGRLLGDLLDGDEGVLLYAPAGAAPSLAQQIEGREARLLLAGGRGLHSSPQLFAQLAESDAPDERDIEGALATGQVSLLVLTAEWVTPDGAVLAAAGAGRAAEIAMRHGVPRYVVSYDGPDAGAAEAGDGSLDRIPGDRLSAIITARGIYRPEMVARFHGGEPPGDIIPLTGGSPL